VRQQRVVRHDDADAAGWQCVETGEQGRGRATNPDKARPAAPYLTPARPQCRRAKTVLFQHRFLRASADKVPETARRAGRA
jgi:hypothetical protein